LWNWTCASKTVTNSTVIWVPNTPFNPPATPVSDLDFAGGNFGNLGQKMVELLLPKIRRAELSSPIPCPLDCNQNPVSLSLRQTPENLQPHHSICSNGNTMLSKRPKMPAKLNHSIQNKSGPSPLLAPTGHDFRWAFFA